MENKYTFELPNLQPTENRKVRRPKPTEPEPEEKKTWNKNYQLIRTYSLTPKHSLADDD